MNLKQVVKWKIEEIKGEDYKVGKSVTNYHVKVVPNREKLSLIKSYHGGEGAND
jgi:hypothetical protein